MHKGLIFLLIFLFCIIFHDGNALFECPVPPNSSLIYLDLEKLNLLVVQQGCENNVHLPLLCVKGKDEECSEQNCCPGEQGCCLNNRDNKMHVRNCGCKVRNGENCTFPAPYAILANSDCGTYGIRQITTCLRESRGYEYLAKTYDLNDSSWKDKSVIYEVVHKVVEIGWPTIQ